MPGSYTHSTVQNLIDQTAQELGEPGKRFFTAAQLELDVREALRVWNSLTGYYRDTGYFMTSANEGLYDLGAKLPNFFASTVTDRDIVTAIQYRLMETVEPIAGSWSEMFTHAGVVRTLQQRRNRFLSETRQVVTKKNPVVVIAGNGLVPLDDTVIQVVRAVWKTPDNQYYNLQPSDESAATSMLPSWRQAPGRPKSFSLTNQPNLTLQLIPPPNDNGELLLMTVDTGVDLNTGIGTVLGVHDDSAWGLGWGVMEDLLLRDGIGRDPERAQFCAQMYALSVDLAKTMPSVLGVTMINDVMYEATSVSMLDSMRTGWQGRTPDRPKTPALIGDWLALEPVPDNEYNIGILAVKKTPQPALGDDLQLGREQLNAIVQWAKQLALFKCEGAQLQQGIQGAGLMIEQARTYNEARIRQSTYLAEMYGLSTDQTWRPQREARGMRTDADDPRDTASSRDSRNRNAGYENPRKRLGGR